MSGMSTSTMESVADDWAEKYDYPMVFPMGLVVIGRASADLGMVVVDHDAWWAKMPGDDSWSTPLAFGTAMDHDEFPKTARAEMAGEFLFEQSGRKLAIADRPTRHGHPEDRPDPAPVFRPVDETVGYVTYRFPVSRTTYVDGSTDYSVLDATPVSYEFEDAATQDDFVARAADDAAFFDGSMVDPGDAS